MVRSSFLLILLFSMAPAWGQSCAREAGTPMDMQIQLTMASGPDQTVADANIGVATASNDGKHGTSNNSGQQMHEFNAAMNIRIELQDSLGTRVAEGQPNGEGRVSFLVCSRNTYRLRVTGTNIEEATAENLEPGRGDKMVNLSLHRKGEDSGKQRGAAASISASRLKIPKKAQKALNKGNTALAAGKIDEARTDFQEAISAYPQFDQAYNNLGVTQMQAGDRAAGKAAFEKAIEINPHFARALSNLAKIAMDEKQFAKGLGFIRRSLATEPLNPKSLMDGVELAYFSGSYPEAVSYTRTLHSLKHDDMGVAHYLCARSLEKQGLLDQAVAEYQLFMQEDPQDPNVPRAQMAVAGIKATNRP